jgi:hypothetical protein
MKENVKETVQRIDDWESAWKFHWSLVERDFEQ